MQGLAAQPQHPRATPAPGPVRAMSAVVTSPQWNGRARGALAPNGRRRPRSDLAGCAARPVRPGAVRVPTALLLSIVSTTRAVLGNLVFGNLGRFQDSPAFPLGALV